MQAGLTAGNRRGDFLQQCRLSEHVWAWRHRAYRFAGMAWSHQPGTHLIETPVGNVSATLHEDGSVSVENVPARRGKKQLSVSTSVGTVTGDIAWGGNWFFLINDHPFTLEPAQFRSLPSMRGPYVQGWKPPGSAAMTAAKSAISTLCRRRRCRQPQFRTVPGESLGSLAVRHRNQRQTGLSGRRWQAAARRTLARGQYYRQSVYRQLYAQRRRYHSDDPRRNLGLRRYPADPQPGRSLLLGDRVVNHGDVM